MQQRLLQMHNISIAFPGVQALTGVDFDLSGGVIQALVGANGAGKSTLMKILAGAYEHYSGAITIDGQFVEIRSPRDAKKLGINIVYQEVDTALVPSLTVAENIMLDVLVNQMGQRQFVNWHSMRTSARDILARLHIDLDPTTLVQDLSLAQKQMVLIARALAEECRFLVLDEPTAPLSHVETHELFHVMRELAQKHLVGIVFISHRLPELIEVCDAVTIMRDGRVVTRQALEQLTTRQIVEWMLGQKLNETYPKAKVEIGETLFEVSNLSEGGAVRDCSLSVRAGEIVGIAGLVGAGKTELCKTIFGALPIASGEMRLYGKQLGVRSPHDAVAQGIALVPEERRKEGVFVSEPISTNLSVASLGKFCNPLHLIRTRVERIAARGVISDLRIQTPNEEQKVAFLSGGNQQKVVIGKWLITEAQIYIFDEPTKGIDLGAKHEIFELIGQLTQAGKGIIYASCDLAEILSITDRLYVMYDHMIVQELETAHTTEEEILYYSTGGHKRVSAAEGAYL